MNRMNTQPSSNGHAKSKPKPKAPRKRPARTQEQNEAQASRRWGRRQVKKAAMIVMGIAIPLLSLGLSHTGGTLLRERENLFHCRSGSCRPDPHGLCTGGKPVSPGLVCRGPDSLS
jgi:hypothetical protein